MKLYSLFSTVVFTAAAAMNVQGQGLQPKLNNPVLFVTQVQPTGDHNTVLAIDGSLLATTAAAPRGGDLMIVYKDETVKNLTRAAGYGIEGSDQKGDKAIAVRDPHVHFSGTKALFSMVVGAPSSPSDTRAFYWQIYEITKLGASETPEIKRVEPQRADYNNVQPAYLSDGRIVFASDAPVTGERHLYPALDEDGLGPAGTGLWTTSPQAPVGTEPALLTHSTSGAAEPFVDSYGRVMFTRWDVLQRDKLATAPDRVLHDYQSEAPASTYGQYSEVFPEPLQSTSAPFGLKFDLFFPWTVNQDGGNLQTLNHLGRHELALDFARSGPDDGMVDFTSNEFIPSASVGSQTRAGSFFQMSEHPYSPGRYIGTDVAKTGLSAGRLVMMVVDPKTNPDLVTVVLVSTSGFSRDPSWLSNGYLMGAWTSGPQAISGSYGAPATPDVNAPAGAFSIRLANGNQHLETSRPLAIPINRLVRQYIGGQEVAIDKTLHQLQPVEVTPRTVPVVTTPATTPVEGPEASVYIRNGVSPTAFSGWLQQRNKALLTARNVTTRDAADRQQPFNLKVTGGVSTTVGNNTAKTIERVQFFQGQYLRAYSGAAGGTPEAGRRITARTMAAGAFASNPPSAGPEGSAPIATDGSMAAIVPAGRATTWQLTDPNHNAVVRERYWLSFKAGELRACTSCHGANTVDQTGKPPATNPPEALNSLLTWWKSANPGTAQASSYKVWSEVNLQNPAGATSQADDDGDSLTNLQEFVYGSNPRSKAQPAGEAQVLTAARGDSGATVLTFTRNKDAAGTEVIAESSADLANWQEVARVGDSAPTSRPEVTVTESTTAAQSSRRLSQWTVSVPPDGTSRQYFRLKFSVP